MCPPKCRSMHTPSVRHIGWPPCGRPSPSTHAAGRKEKSARRTRAGRRWAIRTAILSFRRQEPPPSQVHAGRRVACDPALTGMPGVCSSPNHGPCPQPQCPPGVPASRAPTPG
ncbi:hypothetical protein H696_01007 [Fonticula alba]|uniref:Uncharacterized protein n=1 Tax=Fonticula alba TaxID=691883 RepID=A0A058ZHR9_FONAL|nr:hypothetical protein H696_01007 [Fonticula alba]KCV73468.1 hypothetical protein H696_01007 [Fonticula alba]|eukprot:XP_009493169.1 hypothetical protein H696_01007 [Fonticula alba]